MKLAHVLQAWNADNAKKVIKEEIEKLDSTLLPLQKGLSLSSYVSDKPFSVTVLNLSNDNESKTVKVGVFYTGIIAGCSCADDPSPQDEQNEYCELQFIIDKNTAETRINLLSG